MTRFPVFLRMHEHLHALCLSVCLSTHDDHLQKTAALALHRVRLARRSARKCSSRSTSTRTSTIWVRQLQEMLVLFNCEVPACFLSICVLLLFVCWFVQLLLACLFACLFDLVAHQCIYLSECETWVSKASKVSITVLPAVFKYQNNCNRWTNANITACVSHHCHASQDC